MMLEAFKQRIQAISARYPNVQLLAERTTKARKPKPEQTYMHPEAIKAAIRMKGMTAAMIADDLEVSQSSVSHVINKRTHSERIEEFIATLIEKPREELFPRKPSLLRRSAKEVNHG